MVAQLVERWFEAPQVPGSTPGRPTLFFENLNMYVSVSIVE